MKMTTLLDQIIEYQQQAIANIPEETLKKMMKATEDLKASGMATGLNVGDKAPNFTLQDPSGKDVSLYEQLEKGPVVLTFYRGAWCPYCNLELKAYQSVVADIHAAGAELIAVSPQTPDNSLTMKEKHDLQFPVLSDINSETIKAYNLLFELPDYLIEIYNTFGLDVPGHNGEDSWTLPVPATFIIDQEGIIRIANVDPDYTKRMEPSQVVEEVKKLK
jgi:peroxiredoxin